MRQTFPISYWFSPKHLYFEPHCNIFALFWPLEYLCSWIFVLLNICVLFFFRSSILHACSSYFSVPWNYSCSVVLCFQMVLYLLQVTTSIFTTKHYSSSHLFFRLKIQQFLKKFRKIQVPTRKKYTKSFSSRTFLVNMNIDAITSDFMFTKKKFRNFLAAWYYFQLSLLIWAFLWSHCWYSSCSERPTSMTSLYNRHKRAKSLTFAYPSFSEHPNFSFRRKKHKLSFRILRRSTVEL